MLDDTTVDRFARLFIGRTDAWGGDEGRAVWQPTSRTLYRNHLTGTQGIGIYPIKQRQTDDEPLQVRWGCCDIDTGDWGEAYRLGVALEKMGMAPWIERSRSKGWHIWVFAEEWVHAWEMRRALKVAYAAIGLPAKEANPKSEKLRANQLGNYVRLPYKGWFTDGNKPHRQVMMHNFTRSSDGDVLGFHDFLDNVTGVPTDTITRWAAKWHEPKRELHLTAEELLADDKLQALASRMKPSTRNVWANGPKTADRSATLSALAYALRNQGFNPQECYQLILAADRMWGKYHLRNGGEGYITDIVERVYV